MKFDLKNEELVIINNALIEVLELLPEVDYSTRIGATKKEIEDLLARVRKELDTL